MADNTDRFQLAVDKLVGEGITQQEVFSKLKAAGISGSDDPRIEEFTTAILGPVKDSRKFVPDEATGIGGAVKAAVRSVGEIATFGQAERISAGVQAGVQELGETVGLRETDKENFKQKYKRIFQEEKELSKDIADQNPIINVLGNIGGFFVNPFSRFFQVAAKSAKTVKGLTGLVAAEVGSVETVESVIDTVARLREEPEKSFKQIAGDEALQAITTTVAGAAGGLIAGSILRPTIKKDLAKLGIKNVEQGRGKLDEFGTKAMDIINDAKQGIQDELQDSVTKNSIVAQDFIAGLNDGLETVAAKVVNSVKKGLPKGVAESLSELTQFLQLSNRQLNTGFGQALKPFVEKTAGKTIKAAPVKTALVDVLTKEGSMVIDDAGRIAFTKEAGDETTQKLFKEILNKESFNYSELQSLLVSLGPAFRGQVDTPGQVAAKTAWGEIRNIMSDGAIWGDDVAQGFNALQREYSIALSAMKGAKRIFQRTKEAATRMSDDQNLFKNVEELQLNLSQLGKKIDTLDGLTELNNVLDSGQVQVFKKTLSGVRQVFEVKRASNIKRVKTVMEKIFKGKLEIDPTDKRIVSAINDWKQGTEVLDAVRATKIGQEIHGALSDPFNKTAVTKAEKWINTFAKDLAPEFKQTINRAAKWHRLGGFDKITKPSEALKLARQFAENGEVEALELGMAFSEDLKKILIDSAIAETFVNKRGLVDKDIGEVMLLLFRNARNPMNLLKLVVDAGREMTPKEAIRISGIATRAAELGAIAAGQSTTIKDAQQVLTGQGVEK